MAGPLRLLAAVLLVAHCGGEAVAVDPPSPTTPSIDDPHGHLFPSSPEGASGIGSLPPGLSAGVIDSLLDQFEASHLPELEARLHETRNELAEAPAGDDARADSIARELDAAMRSCRELQRQVNTAESKPN